MIIELPWQTPAGLLPIWWETSSPARSWRWTFATGGGEGASWNDVSFNDVSLWWFDRFLTSTYWRFRSPYHAIVTIRNNVYLWVGNLRRWCVLTSGLYFNFWQCGSESKTYVNWPEAFCSNSWSFVIMWATFPYAVPPPTKILYVMNHPGFPRRVSQLKTQLTFPTSWVLCFEFAAVL